MKMFIAFAFYLFSILTPFQSIPFNDIEKAVAEADANKVISYSTDKILVSIDTKESIYSKSQATIVLKDFFAKHPAQSFTFTIKTLKQENISFASGVYASKDAKYRITFQFKKVGEEFKINKISISEV